VKDDRQTNKTKIKDRRPQTSASRPRRRYSRPTL